MTGTVAGAPAPASGPGEEGSGPSWTDLRGWFQVGWVDQLGDEAMPISALGLELVAWLDASRSPVVADARCPHMGAHLGHGSSLVDGCVRCPLHGWTWAGDGRNRSIPGTDDTTARRLGVRHSTTYRGALLVWLDPAGSAPDHDPEVELGTGDGTAEVVVGGHPDTTAVWRSTTIHPQVAIEDRVDVDHFAGPHATARPELVELDLRAASFTSEVRHGAGTEPGSRISSTVVGVGLSHLTVQFGDQVAEILLAVTPVADGRSDVFHTVWCRGADAAMAERAIQAVVPLMRTELEHDMVIWEHLVHVPEVSSEHFASAGAIRQVRAWSRRWYGDPERV
ncbi:Rieske 2Fe-2S domain-containing protein [Dermatobacter hominis]|uniref:Rieske 2Fe-2S domain-containing protein n=1 Tax=Dermatobacter hominis TaxID=2884263 RepID=UPI001D11A9DA|nr:Rieske 2Fe-2S domain-containing protein [Dermatobacter hominis]UDY33955.1 Rieske 2Fe-2S domain-containing protein [Dermatobacter hominis]